MDVFLIKAYKRNQYHNKCMIEIANQIKQNPEQAIESLKDYISLLKKELDKHLRRVRFNYDVTDIVADKMGTSIRDKEIIKMDTILIHLEELVENNK